MNREPARKNVHDLARDLGISAKMLKELSESPPLYTRRPQIKASGKRRLIEEPDHTLKRVQRAIHGRILKKYQYPPHLHAYIVHRSYVSNTAAHVGSAYFYCLDIADFFPSLHHRRIREVFGELGYSGHARIILERLTTYRGRLPQGAPTSPLLANLAFVPVDDSLLSCCCLAGLKFTRYSDDLTFSSTTDFESHVTTLRAIVQAAGYKIKENKTHYFREGERPVVTGAVITRDGLEVRPEKLGRILDLLDLLTVLHCEGSSVPSDFPTYPSMDGMISYVSQIDIALGANLRSRLVKAGLLHPTWAKAGSGLRRPTRN